MAENTIASDMLHESQQTILHALLGAILPADPTLGVPAGNDHAILQDILQTIRISAHELVSKGLEDLDNASAKQFDAGFEGIEAAKKIALFNDMRIKNNRFYSVLSSVILQCYYRNDQVMESLGMEARPPFPKGHQVPQGDFSLLDPVKARGKIWRDT